MDINGRIEYKFRPDRESDKLLARLILAQAYVQGKKHCLKVLTNILQAVNTSSAYNKVEKAEITRIICNDYSDLRRLSRKGGYDE